MVPHISNIILLTAIALALVQPALATDQTGLGWVQLAVAVSAGLLALGSTKARRFGLVLISGGFASGLVILAAHAGWDLGWAPGATILEAIALIYLSVSLAGHAFGAFRDRPKLAFSVLAPSLTACFLSLLSLVYGVGPTDAHATLLTMNFLDATVMTLIALHILLKPPLLWPVDVLASSYPSLRLSRYFLILFTALPVTVGGLVINFGLLERLDPKTGTVLFVFVAVVMFALIILKGAGWAYRLGRSRDLAVRRLEESWRSREAYFRNLVDDSPVILYLSGENGGCTFLSKKWQEYTGRPPVKDLGFGWLECVHPEDRAKIQEAAKGIKFKSFESVSYEYRLRRWDGEYRWVVATGFPRFDDRHHFVGYMGNVIDIHERKVQEDVLKKDKQTAEQSVQTKSQFLANMSHEIRTPLNAILGFADLCADGDCSESERIEYLKRIRGNGDHLLRLIDDILDLAKMESGAGLVQRSLFSLERLMDEILGSLRALASQKGLILELDRETELPEHVFNDPHRIKQVVNNLVGNAIKFTAQGGVRVRVGWRDQLVTITIEDTGIGLSGAQVSNLFKPFSQGDSSVTRKFGGTGLGLHLSRKLAQSIGGDVTLAMSEVGKGSTFRFTFDIGSEEERRPKPAPRRRQTLGQPSEKPASRMWYGHKIMVAEDSPDGRELIELYFRSTGAQLIFAGNGFEAVDKALAERPQLILMDVQMPGMDGLEATRRLRQAGFNRPIVALTAHALQDEVDRSFEAGCNYHLTKPVMRDVLLSLVGELLAHAPPPRPVIH